MRRFIYILSLVVLLITSSEAQTSYPLITRFKYASSDTSHSEPPPEINDTIYAIWNGGQSNDAGRVSASSYLSGGNAYLADSVYIGDDSCWIRSYLTDAQGSFQVLHAGVNSSDGVSDNRFGVQVKIGYDMVDWSGKNIYIFQAAQGGQNIVMWTQSVRDLYKYCDSGVAAVNSYFTSRGKYVKWLAAIWIQGESNGTTDTTVYKGYLDSLLTLTREWTGNATLPFFEVQMQDCQTGVSNLARLQLCQQTWAWTNAANGVHFFPKSLSGGCQDSLHFNGDTIFSLSDAMTALLQSLYPYLEE